MAEAAAADQAQRNQYTQGDVQLSSIAPVHYNSRTPPQLPSRPSGILYAWGAAGMRSLPVAREAMDKENDCVFPARVVLPKGYEHTRFVAAAADVGLFAAVDALGHLWVWGSERTGFPNAPARAMADVCSCDVHRTRVFAVSKAKLYEISANKSSQAAAPRLSSAASSPSSPLAVNQLDLPAIAAESAHVLGVTACNQTHAIWCADGSAWGNGPALTNGHGGPDGQFARIAVEGHVLRVVLGSRTGAALTRDGVVWLWGDGLQGTLAVGKRLAASPLPRPCTLFRDAGHVAVDIACTRGQPEPKRLAAPPERFAAGQEGPRVHVVTADGGLWICGTTHKGLGANCLNKTMNPDADLLSFYRVGGEAADIRAPAVWTGAAEELRRDPVGAAQGMGMAAAEDFGRDGRTHYLDTAQVVVSVAAHIHALAVARDGRLFAWGCGSDGRLGLNAYLRGPGGTKRRLKCYVSTPSAVEHLMGRRVVAAAAGRYWTLAIVDE